MGRGRKCKDCGHAVVHRQGYWCVRNNQAVKPNHACKNCKPREEVIMWP